MSTLLPLFSNNLLPILLTAGAGLLISKTIALDARTISRITFYIFSPCLVFQLLTESQLNHGAILQMVGFAFSANLLVGLIAFIVVRALKMDKSISIAIILSAILTNAGNYGLSLNKFAFGDEALAYASIFFICSGIMVYTVGVAIASLGQAQVKDALLNLLKFPTMYALFLAIIFNFTGWHLPLFLQRSVDQLADGAIPTMLLVLGMQLGSANITGKVGPIALATGLRLVVAPIVAFGLSIPFGLQGSALQAGVTEASTPTAVMTTILATEFDTEPSLIATVVAVTTILSPLTLTPIIAILGGV